MELNPFQGQQAEIYKLVRENNKMLHSMRRNALWGGILKFLIYAVLLLGPIWLYVTYVNGPVQQILHTVNQVQATGADAKAQVVSVQEQLIQMVKKMSSFLYAPSSGVSTSTSE